MTSLVFLARPGRERALGEGLLGQPFEIFLVGIADMQYRFASLSAHITVFLRGLVHDDVVGAAKHDRNIEGRELLTLAVENDHVGGAVVPAMDEQLVSMNRDIGDVGIADDDRRGLAAWNADELGL